MLQNTTTPLVEVRLCVNRAVVTRSSMVGVSQEAIEDPREERIGFRYVLGSGKINGTCINTSQ